MFVQVGVESHLNSQHDTTFYLRKGPNVPPVLSVELWQREFTGHLVVKGRCLCSMHPVRQ